MKLAAVPFPDHRGAVILHAPAYGGQLDLQIEDRFGNPVKPRKWFLYPYMCLLKQSSESKTGASRE
jgi:hypothetical protein